MAIVVGSLLILWGIGVAYGSGIGSVHIRRVWWIVVPFMLTVFWAALQMSPIMPDGWHHPFWTTSAEALGVSTTSSISINPQKTLEGILRLLTYGGIFWLALQSGRNERHVQLTFYGIAIASGLYAAYGLAVEFTNSQTILWYDKTSYLWSLTSTFVNRNSFAAYAGIGLICTTALLWKNTQSVLGSAMHQKDRRRLLFEYFSNRGWLLLATWFILVVALLLTDSRGGLISTIVGMLVFFLAVAISGRSSSRWIFITITSTIVIGSLFFMLSGDIVSKRFEEIDLEKEARLRLYERTITAIQDSSILGTGLGTFEDVFRFYRTDDLQQTYKMAHNTYLENALELGIPAASLLTLSVIGGVVLCAFGVLQRRRNITYPAIGVAVSALVGVHSLIDFSLQIPAVSATYFLILGIACAQSWSSRIATEKP